MLPQRNQLIFFGPQKLLIDSQLHFFARILAKITLTPSVNSRVSKKNMKIQKVDLNRPFRVSYDPISLCMAAKLN